jgi:hypothetical protein
LAYLTLSLSTHVLTIYQSLSIACTLYLEVHRLACEEGCLGREVVRSSLDTVFSASLKKGKKEWTKTSLIYLVFWDSAMHNFSGTSGATAPTAWIF